MCAPRIVGVVLAAGSSSRMGRSKAELVLAGQRLIDRSIDSMRSCADILVVAREGLDVDHARIVVNPYPARGMRSSLELALAHTGPADAVAVTLVDLPGVGSSAVDAVISGWQPGRIAVGLFDGRRGHPTVMSPRLWRCALLLAEPDAGARRLLAARPDLVDEILAKGNPHDVDTPQDLASWTNRT